jgi:cell fate regulator YaaT (PSP1 superfamily)
MAKEQGLSLNPSKISGSCGRLMCCLSYEQPAYEYLNSITPGIGSVVKTADGNGIVVETSLMRGMVKVSLDKNRDGMPKEYAVKDIAVLKKVHHNKKNSNTDSVSEKELRALED